MPTIHISLLQLIIYRHLFFTIPSSPAISLFFLIPTFCFCFSSSSLYALCTSVLSSVLICYFISAGSMWTLGWMPHLAMSENVKQFWLRKPATIWEGIEGGFKPTRKACPIKVSLAACNYNFSYTYTGLLETVQTFLSPTPFPPVCSLHSCKQIRNQSGSQYFGTPQGPYLIAYVTSCKQIFYHCERIFENAFNILMIFFRISNVFYSRSGTIIIIFLRYIAVPVQFLRSICILLAIANTFLMLEVLSVEYSLVRKMLF